MKINNELISPHNIESISVPILPNNLVASTASGNTVLYSEHACKKSNTDDNRYFIYTSSHSDDFSSSVKDYISAAQKTIGATSDESKIRFTVRGKRYQISGAGMNDLTEIIENISFINDSCISDVVKYGVRDSFVTKSDSQIKCYIYIPAGEMAGFIECNFYSNDEDNFNYGVVIYRDSITSNMTTAIKSWFTEGKHASSNVFNKQYNPDWVSLQSKHYTIDDVKNINIANISDVNYSCIPNHLYNNRDLLYDKLYINNESMINTIGGLSHLLCHKQKEKDVYQLRNAIFCSSHNENMFYSKVTID